MRTLKRHLRYLSRVRPDLLRLLGISVGLFITIEIAGYWPAFSYWTWRLGQAVSALAMAYITAFIFYYMVNHLQEETDREVFAQAMRPYAFEWTLTNIGFIEVFGADLSGNHADFSMKGLVKLLEDADLKQADILEDEKDPTNTITVAEYVEGWAKRRHHTVNEILALGLKIDADLLSYLHRIRENTAEGTKNFQFLRGDEFGPHRRWRMAETIYFSHVIWKRIRRYPERVFEGDHGYTEAVDASTKQLKETLERLQPMFNKGKTAGDPKEASKPK